MKAPVFDYQTAESVEEVVALLAEHGDDAKVLAGGQSLIPLLSLRLAAPAQLIDINRLDELASLDTSTGLHIGATVRQRAIERSSDVVGANPLVAEAVKLIGHGAIRNRGTVGGSIAHSDPSAELPAVVLALDGVIEARGPSGSRDVPAADFFKGFLTNGLADDELLVSVRFPPWESDAGWSFTEFSRRSGDFAVAGVAATLRVDGDGRVAEARIALSGMADRPIRASAAEQHLAGQGASADVFAAAAQEAVAGLEPPSDLHGTSEYRKHLGAVLVRRALHEALDRSKGTA